MSRIGCIIQARLDSTRLCHKVLREIHGKTVLRRVVEACQDSMLRTLNPILTTPDVAIAEWAESRDIFVHLWRGERDLLAEFHHVAEIYRIDTIVRLTADCPMLTGERIDDGIKLYLDADAEYAYNGLDGADVEVFSRKVLEKAFAKAKEPDEREHVTLYMARHMRYFAAEVDEDTQKLYKSLDTMADLEYIRSVMKP